MNDTRRSYTLISGLAFTLIAHGVGGQSPSWPSARAKHHLVYDAAARQVFLVGGSSDGVLWTWDGRAWQSQASTLAPRATTPQRSIPIADG